ncbi:DUF1090 domain-containing protein [Stenotrophomonas sp. C3(2023)]|uniref:DUF1090 domain-containing protein n=1 Tax=Stenotrophomonas sp. C3(2023) TaxID=3080277 RepID=UPI00293C3EC2|nr:DUF1090 domain-containing protein [Stenotrophomonas sp. C3(2023)]MDV3469891.1 DUF1090 domain-containing protein [Stenotrophomonas sp. C3(2023)]
MKKILLTAIVPVALLMGGNAFAGTQSCDAKVASIQAQIEVAKQYGNQRQLAGLQTALAQAKAHCTDAGQANRAEQKVREAQEDVRKVQEDVREAEGKLREAQGRNDAKKIAKAQDKLSEKQFKLREKMEKLRQAQADLAALKG